MRSKTLVALSFVLIGVLLVSVSNINSSNNHYVGGSSSHLSYISGLVTSIDTSKKILQLRPEDNSNGANNDRIVIDCSSLYPTEFEYSFDSLSTGDLVTIGYFPPFKDSIKAYCIAEIHKGDNEMNDKTEKTEQT